MSPRTRKHTPPLGGSPEGSPIKTLAGLLDLGESQNPRLRGAENDTLSRSGPYQHKHGHYELNVLNPQIQKNFITNPQHTLHEKEGTTFYGEHPVQFCPTGTVFNELYTKGLKSQPSSSPQPFASAIRGHGGRKLHTSIPNNANAEAWADTRPIIDSPPLSGLSDVHHNHDFNGRTNAGSDDPKVARVPVIEPQNSSQNYPATQNEVTEPPGPSHLSRTTPPEMEDWKDMFDWDSWSNKRIKPSTYFNHQHLPRPYAPADTPPPPSYTSPIAEGVMRSGSPQSRLFTIPSDDKPLGMRKPSVPESEPLSYSGSRSLSSAMIDSLSRGLEHTHLANTFTRYSYHTPLPAQSQNVRLDL